MYLIIEHPQSSEIKSQRFTALCIKIFLLTFLHSPSLILTLYPFIWVFCPEGTVSQHLLPQYFSFIFYHFLSLSSSKPIQPNTGLLLYSHHLSIFVFLIVCCICMCDLGVPQSSKIQLF